MHWVICGGVYEKINCTILVVSSVHGGVWILNVGHGGNTYFDFTSIGQRKYVFGVTSVGQRNYVFDVTSVGQRSSPWPCILSELGPV